MVEMLRRTDLAKKYKFCPAMISRFEKEMEASGLFDSNSIWRGRKVLFIDEQAFKYFMAHRNEIKAGVMVPKYRRTK